jgi:hypothetical protein
MGDTVGVSMIRLRDRAPAGGPVFAGDDEILRSV